jgi:hypothetical protein
MLLKGTRGAASRSSASLAWMRSWNSGGKAPVSMNDATWPTFIAAPFIWPRTSKICSAASICRRAAASWRPCSSRARFAAFVA